VVATTTAAVYIIVAASVAATTTGLETKVSYKATTAPSKAVQAANSEVYINSLRVIAAPTITYTPIIATSGVYPPTVVVYRVIIGVITGITIADPRYVL
jgi:hypothetical protein